MKKRITTLSLGYWFSAYSLGLLVHPYKTVRELEREKRFRALLWSPTVYWVMLWIAGEVLLRLGGMVVRAFGIVAFGEVILVSLGFLWWWISVFLLLWQGMLWYLGWRFGKLARK